MPALSSRCWRSCSCPGWFRCCPVPTLCCTMSSPVLCCAVLCRAVPCRVLCCAVLCWAVLRCAVLRCAALCCAVLAVLYITVHHPAMPCHVVPGCAILYCVMPCCDAPCCAVLIMQSYVCLCDRRRRSQSLIHGTWCCWCCTCIRSCRSCCPAPPWTLPASWEISRSGPLLTAPASGEQSLPSTNLPLA